MSSAHSFAVLAQRLAAGDPTAADEVFRRYADKLIALARSRLDPRLAARVDPEDAVQSALRSFFVRHAAGQFQLNDSQQLWGLLVCLTQRKCLRQARQHFAGQRDVRLEESPPATDDSAPPDVLGLARDPTPVEAAMMRENVERVMERLGTPLKRRVFEMTLQGYAVAEIAAEVNYYERGVERIRAEIRSLLSELSQD